MTLFLVYIILIIACLVACTTNRQYLLATYRYFQILFIAVLLFELSGLAIEREYNNVIDHFYQPLEFILITLIYKNILRNKVLNRYWLVIVPLFLITSFYLSIFIEGLHMPNTYSFLLGSTIIVLYALIYVYELYANPPEHSSLFTNPYFWINTGNLFFYCGTFFQMGLSAYIARDNETLAKELSIIIKLLNYALYSLYLIGFLCKKIFL
ncbi:hypothetical protein LVD17_07055 [Fulvivirga ulvae]|uniref:hypothetical protein n=1 Tax=Fulvivirga ulvae TaxID=2904245 RepID=UPI001F23870F|nr:hypothetical protein [Fulvivirga ulvae]UII32786.1 hypothetical protein LVD17_02930 [Fulvivirga ulvae]UII33575.1 hypothetical protein LVD17_07055 [Fulvivirga ulvae]